MTSELSPQKIEDLMRLAQAEARKAIETGNAPFAAVLADIKGNIITKAYNTANRDCDPTAHAKIIVLRQAGKFFGLAS